MLLTESEVIAQLNELKQQMLDVRQASAKLQYEGLATHYDTQLKALIQKHQKRKQQRDEKRSHAQNSLTGESLTSYLLTLQQESQQDGMEKRRLKQERDSALLPLEKAIAQTKEQLQQLKQQYTTISADWQTHIQQVYFTALAQTDRAAISLTILYEDDDVLVIDKPAGLLSVPGRRAAQQDSVISRLRYLRPEGSFLQAVHRLDQATSGLLAIALTRHAHRSLSQQFAQRQVRKTYEAVLSKPIAKTTGIIALPLRADTINRPMQVVDWQHGKPSQTAYDVIPGFPEATRIRFMPKTGRTHQLRVHAAHAEGLNAPILGDRLYGDNSISVAERLHLHATGLSFIHPSSGEPVSLDSEAPF